MTQFNSEKMEENGFLIPTTIALESVDSKNMSLHKDMTFNEGHMLSIIVYRFVYSVKLILIFSIALFYEHHVFLIPSILMVISAIGNITVLTILIRRRMRTPSRLDIMLTHLAIADLMVSL